MRPGTCTNCWIAALTRAVRTGCSPRRVNICDAARCCSTPAAGLGDVVAALARLLRPGGTLLVYTTVATDLLEPGESEMLGRHLGNVVANLVERNLEIAFADAGLRVAEKHAIGTEWQEYAEER